MTNGRRKPSGSASACSRPRLSGDTVATTIKKGAHVLVEGSLVSMTYERANGKGKKAKTNKQTFWCIRAMSSASSTAANLNRKQSIPVLPLRVKRSTRPIRLRSNGVEAGLGFRGPLRFSENVLRHCPSNSLWEIYVASNEECRPAYELTPR